jgi:hypothetical protein
MNDEYGRAEDSQVAAARGIIASIPRTGRPSGAIYASYPPCSPSLTPTIAGGPGASGALHRDPVVTVAGHRSEPVSPTPAASRDPSTTAALEAPVSRVAKVVMARTDAAHVGYGRVGLPLLRRAHARRGHHRGPRRHPEDSLPPRAPDRGATSRPPPSDLFDWS